MRQRASLSGGRALFAWLVLGWAAQAKAEVIHIPVGSKPVQLSDGRVFCEALGPAFSAEPGAKMVRAPTNADQIGTSVDVRVAPTAAACDESTTTVTLVAIGKQPEIDRSTIWLAADEGRIDAQGDQLLGSSIVWKSGSTEGVDTCNAPRAVSNGKQECSWSVARGISVAPDGTQFYVLPAGARTLDDATFFDALGRRVSAETFAVRPARSTLLRVVMADASVDLSTGQGEIPLSHPEAVASAECGVLSCEMIGGKLIVRGGSNAVTAVEVKVRLAPDVFVYRNEAFLTVVSAKLPAMHCPMSIVSGSPFRDAQDAKVIVRLEGRCGKEIGALTFTREERVLKTLDILRGDFESYAVLRLGEVRDEAITLHAVRGENEGVVVASAQAQTRPAPQARATLELAGHKNLSLIPNNRPAIVHVSPAGEKLRFQILPIEGIYRVIEAASGSMIQADPNAAGLTSLRFGLRATHLPDRLNKVDLATVTDPLQRGTSQINIPVPIEPAEGRPTPLVEVWCGGGGREAFHEIRIGETAHLPFSMRDTCRVVFHRELLPPEFGTQKLNFEVDVLRSDGSSKPEGHVSEVITLRPGDMPRYAWISGITNPFERISIRVSHVADENHYLGAEDVRTGAPAAQWSAVLGTGRVRLYGTTTIPTGLYRFSKSDKYSGTLGLNFGVISRLTWLDEEGKEGLVGAEAGVLVFGLANTASGSDPSLRQIGAVVGLGFAVPIANRNTPTQASINLHAWLEINLTGSGEQGRYAFVFGPSISIGSVGVNL